MTTMRKFPFQALVAWAMMVFCATDECFALTPLFAASISHGGTSGSASGGGGDGQMNKDGLSFNELPPLPTNSVVKSVAVIGATGRTGKYAVEELLNRKVPTVVAVVRDLEKAAKLFPNPPSNLVIVQCDLMNQREVQKVCDTVDAALWCATGLSSAAGGRSNPFQTAVALMGIAFQRTIDNVGLTHVAKGLREENKAKNKPFYVKPKEADGDDNSKNKEKDGLRFPKLVMCSSAGVTRPIWDEAKKKQFAGAAEIPIVRLNPFGILDVKRNSEEKLRQSGIDYCIVRPSGLNDNWPAGSRPLFSQGDIAVGRIHRKDVAEVMVDALSTPEATGKTFEVNTLADYPKARSIREPLARLRTDKQGGPSSEALLATYHVLQQILPGERQNAAALAMGQTYEQLDTDQVGRLGKRGKEDLSKV
jgi:uncharacterized protein YbjT (DUF2867 family)